MTNTVRVCSAREVDDLVEFFRNHWSARHVFVRRREVLDWQHLNAEAGTYNFIITRDIKGAVNGMLGFIPSDRFDLDLAGSNNTIWQSTWMVLRSETTRGLGKAQLQHVLDTHRFGWTGTCGLDHGTRKIYDRLGYRTGEIHQYYLLNPDTERYRLVVVPPGTPIAKPAGRAAATALTRETYFAATGGLGLDDGPLVPKKSRLQFYNRYVAHPFFEYRLYLLQHGGDAAILATRLCVHAGARALRIVDFLGSPKAMAEGGAAIGSLLEETGAEYADFYCSGLESEAEAAGLRKVADTPGLVIPSHYEPFEQRNVVLLYALRGPGDHIVICKGDGDQDRPNLLDAVTA